MKPVLFIRGSFVIEFMHLAAEELEIQLINPSVDRGSVDEIEFVNSFDNVLAYVYFPSWSDVLPSNLTDIKHKIVFWNIEDPNHFKSFYKQAQYADAIFTTASEMMDQYEIFYKDKYISCLPWACDPSKHYPNYEDLEFKNRKYDIVFVGNRYPDIHERCLGEMAVLIPTMKWARENGKKVYIFGSLDNSPHSWKSWALMHTASYEGPTNALDTGDIYRDSRIVICLNEQLKSPTMTSMRTYEACACGNIVFSHESIATQSLFGDCLYQSNRPEETGEVLDYLFDPQNAKTILAKAQWATLKMFENHTYRHRIIKMLTELGNISK